MKPHQRVAVLVLAAWAVCVPPAIVDSPGSSAPLPYHVLTTLAAALGMSIIPLVIGLIVLIVARKARRGGLHIALSVVVLFGALLLLLSLDDRSLGIARPS